MWYCFNMDGTDLRAEMLPKEGEIQSVVYASGFG